MGISPVPSEVVPAPASGATFVVYIDESGDEGFSFEKGSSEWFVLSAVIVRKAQDPETVKLVDEVREQLGKPQKKALHFRDLKHEQRLPFVERIAAAPVRAVSVMIHKPSLREPEKFQEESRLYFYGARFVLERVSWYCRDNKTRHDVGDGSAEVVFSNRSGMSYEELRKYLSQLKDMTGIFDVRIVWSVINEERIAAYTHSKRMGLQIADAVAGSFYYAVQPSTYGHTEPRYAVMLKPVVYKRGRYIGYGLKFWPGEVDKVIGEEPRFEWVRNDYK